MPQKFKGPALCDPFAFCLLEIFIVAVGGGLLDVLGVANMVESEATCSALTGAAFLSRDGFLRSTGSMKFL